MAKFKDLTGKRFGKLVVLELVGKKKYGGRIQTVWLCQCDCGNRLELEFDKLPTTPKRQKTMMQSGRRLYDCCEKCREKSCIICGNKFSYSHPSHICPSPDCQTTLQNERDNFWRAVYKFNYQTDEEFRQQERAKQREWYNKNKADIKERRRYREQCMTPEEKRLLFEQRRAANKRKYRRMRADPERYQHWLQWHREWRTKQALKSMLADAEKLHQLFENEAENDS